MKGWRRDPARHSLAARGIKTMLNNETPVFNRETDLRRLMTQIAITEREMALHPERYPDLVNCGYRNGSMGEYLNCDEVVDLIAMPLLREHGYSDARPVVGEVKMLDGTTQSHAWIELRGYIFDPTGDQMGTNTEAHPKLIRKADPLARKYLNARNRQVITD